MAKLTKTTRNTLIGLITVFGGLFTFSATQYGIDETVRFIVSYGLGISAVLIVGFATLIFFGVRLFK